MYRSKFWNRKERDTKKAQKRERWFGKKYNTVMFVDNTRGSALAKECQQVIDKSGLKIKVAERSGTSVKDLITISYPFKRDECDQCAVCDVNENINCRTREVVYRVWCKDCGKVKSYTGETCRSLAERFAEHKKGLETRNISPVVLTHM